MKINREYMDHLIDQGYEKHEIQNAWEKVKSLCKKHQPAYLDQELTLQVMARDFLEGKNVEKILTQSH